MLITMIFGELAAKAAPAANGKSAAPQHATWSCQWAQNPLCFSQENFMVDFFMARSVFLWSKRSQLRNQAYTSTGNR